MLDSLRGRLARIGDNWIAVEVGGVGIRVRVASPAAYARSVGRTVSVHAALDIQTRRWTVFGFPSAEERDAFERLRRIAGIGAATALKLLPRLEELERGKAEALSGIAGIGPAKQKRILRWMKRPEGAAGPGSALVREVKEALRALGVPPGEAGARAARAVGRKPGAALEELVRAAVRGRTRP